MRILLTGASSFTGYWFAKALADAGHEIVATFRGDGTSYSGVRGSRVAGLKGLVEPIWNVELGASKLVEIASSGRFDLFCHHAAEMTNYRSWDFDAVSATAKNTAGARPLIEALKAGGCNRLLLTGSVFEPFEGIGDPQQRAFNPYGLSKHLSFEVFRMEAEKVGMHIGKFVIPNPFGPLEEPRFTSYLAKEWQGGRTPSVGTPVYIRDNIHVSLLALSYRRCCEMLPSTAGASKVAPSGYIESQGAFALRVGREFGARLQGKPFEVGFADQRDFPEPLVRVNATLAAQAHPEWSESEAWDTATEYWREMARSG